MRLKAMSQTLRLIRLRIVKACSGIVLDKAFEGANAQTKSPSCGLSSGHYEIDNTKQLLSGQIAKLAEARVGVMAEFRGEFRGHNTN